MAAPRGEATRIGRREANGHEIALVKQHIADSDRQASDNFDALIEAIRER